MKNFRIHSVKQVNHDSESIPYGGPIIWKIFHAKIKETNSLSSFKIEICRWVPESCLQTLQAIY